MSLRDPDREDESARLAEVREVFSRRLGLAAIAVGILGFLVGVLGSVLK